MTNFNKKSGIHTFELQCGLTCEQSQIITDSLFSLSADARRRCFYPRNFLKCCAFSDKGLTIFACHHLLKLTVNPSRLTDSSNMLGLYDPERRGIAPSEILARLVPLLRLFLPEATISSLYISRADYTIDALLPSDEHALLMIKLAKKNGMPKGFRETYPADIRNAPDFNDSYSYNVSRKDGAYRFNLYSKHKQLSAGRKNIPADMLDQSDGLLRAEISCSYPKNMLPLWQGDAFAELFDPENLLSLYGDILPKLFPYGTHFKSPVAKKMIEGKYKNQRALKKHLLNFLDIVIKYHSFHDAYKKFNNKNILKKDLLDAFYSMGINPVTIAINDKITLLPSIYVILGLNNARKI